VGILSTFRGAIHGESSETDRLITGTDDQRLTAPPPLVSCPGCLRRRSLLSLSPWGALPKFEWVLRDEFEINAVVRQTSDPGQVTLSVERGHPPMSGPNTEELARRGRLLISCPDRQGIVAAVSQFLFEHRANIVHSDQHSTAAEGGVFFMRVEFSLSNSPALSADLQRAFAPIADRFSMDWHLTHANRRERLAIFVSKEKHCLLELLWQREAGDLRAEIAMVVSNHPDLEPIAVSWGIPFHYVPVPGGDKWAAEQKQLQLLDGHADVIVLARYMQILSARFLGCWPGRVINIHHSFLPAFVGARPYEQAHRHGVKLIGATAHYVTEELDAGPIIEQDVARVDHRQSPGDLRRIGRLIEREVLGRAVSWHVDDRVLIHENKTVVFA